MVSSGSEWIGPEELRNVTQPQQASPVLETLVVLMSLAAVTGNVLVVVIVAATKSFHTVTSVLIINLAVSDFLVGASVMPFVAVSIMDHSWFNCTDLCLYVGYTSSVYCTASVLTLAAIALDRYFSIIDCLRYDSHCTMWRTCLVVLWIWIQAIVTSCPPLLGWSSISFMAPVFSCSVNWSKSPSYTVVMSVLSFFIPAVVILFCYVKIVRVARHHAKTIHSLKEHLQQRSVISVSDLRYAQLGTHAPSSLVYYVSGRFVTDTQVEEPPAPSAEERSSRATGGRLQSVLTQLQSSRPRHHGVLRLFLVIFAFFFCWTPYVSVALVQAISPSSSIVPPSVVTFSNWLALFNSDVNPLLYALLSKRFRMALLNLRWKMRGGLGREEVEISRGGGSIHSTTAHTRHGGSRHHLSSLFTPHLRGFLRVWEMAQSLWIICKFPPNNTKGADFPTRLQPLRKKPLSFMGRSLFEWKSIEIF